MKRIRVLSLLLVLALLVMAFPVAARADDSVNFNATSGTRASENVQPSGTLLAPVTRTTPIKIAGYTNVFIYPPELSVLAKGNKMLKYLPGQSPWIVLDNENKILADDIAVLQQLAKYPAAQAALQNVSIYIFPITNFPVGLQGENSSVAGLTIPPGTPGGNYEIWVGLSSPAVLAHELGHALHDKLLAANVYDWTNVNACGQRYLQIHRYNPSLKLDADSQDQLAWKQRIAEWFAEDTSAFLVPNHNSVFLPGGYQDARIQNFLADLFSTGTATTSNIVAVKIVPQQDTYYLGFKYPGSTNITFQSATALRTPQMVAGTCYASLDVASTLLGSTITYDPARSIFGSLIIPNAPDVVLDLDEGTAQKIINDNNLSAMPLCNIGAILSQHGWIVVWDNGTLYAAFLK